MAFGILYGNIQEMVTGQDRRPRRREIWVWAPYLTNPAAYQSKWENGRRSESNVYKHNVVKQMTGNLRRAPCSAATLAIIGRAQTHIHIYTPSETYPYPISLASAKAHIY